MTPFGKRWIVFLYGAINAAVVGAATVIAGVPAGKLIGALDFTGRQLLAMAAGAAISSFAIYIRARQLPPVDDENGAKL